MQLRAVERPEDFDAWAGVKTAVAPDEPTTGDAMRARQRPDRLLLLAEDGGALVGCGLADRSELGGLAVVLARVLPDRRRRGFGTGILLALVEHAAAIGLDELVTYVEGDDRGSQAFAAHFGFEEVDRQVGQVRRIGPAEPPPPPPPDGVEVVTVADRPELLRAAYPLAAACYAELPVLAALDIDEGRWLADEATVPEGSFVALHGGEIVGYAGLMKLGETGEAAEHGLTAVRPDFRGRGLATALKRRQIAYASTHGIGALTTWTQRGNENMQRLNEALGYRTESETLNLRATVAAVLSRPRD
jgi:mycothiol synthase